MNQEERAVIDGIFDRLKGVANQPRDPEAEKHIADLVRAQPYAPYALAQSVFVQEQALLNQQQQIEQLQAQVQQLEAMAQRAQQAPQQSGGFLSGLFGGGAAAQPQRDMPAYGQRGREAPAAPSPWGAPQQNAAPQAGPWGQQAQPQQRQGMGFLGTAAAAAAGVAGGMMLGNILSSAFGGGQAHAATQGLGNLGLDNKQGQQGTEDAGNYEDEGYDETDAGYDDGGFDDDTYEA